MVLEIENHQSLRDLNEISHLIEFNELCFRKVAAMPATTDNWYSPLSLYFLHLQ